MQDEIYIFFLNTTMNHPHPFCQLLPLAVHNELWCTICTFFMPLKFMKKKCFRSDIQHFSKQNGEALKGLGAITALYIYCPIFNEF